MNTDKDIVNTDTFEIFDKDGNKLNTVDVIAQFLKNEAKKLEVRYDGIKVGIGYSYEVEQERLYLTKENGYRITSFRLNNTNI